MSKAKPLKKRLAALEAEVAQCDDPTEQKKLHEKAVRLRKDLEKAGYLPTTSKQPKSAATKRRITKKKTAQNVDPLVRAMRRPGFSSGVVKIVQGGSARGK